MKCLTMSVLSLLFLLSLCACAPATTAEESQGEDEGQETVQEPETPEKEPEPEPPAFEPLVPASQAVPASWFDDAAFVGDSVSVMLDMYNSGTQVLGGADFFCSVSLSQTNARGYATGDSHLPEWPKGSGQHPRIPDGVAASGAKKVYLMLGINCLSGGVDRACQDLVTLVDEILALSPDATILVESVTPMTATSPRADGKLNNEVIAAYNTRMLEICRQREWYFINVAEAVSGENGCLRDEFSGDKSMGIHFNYNGAEAWASYLLTHVPEALKYSETIINTEDE